MQLNSNTVLTNAVLRKLGVPSFEPWVAVWEARRLPLCYVAPILIRFIFQQLLKMILLDFEHYFFQHQSPSFYLFGSKKVFFLLGLSFGRLTSGLGLSEPISRRSCNDFQSATLFLWGQRRWLSWKSARLRHQRSTIRITSAVKFYLPIVQLKIEKTKIKIKKAGNGPALKNL